MSIETFPESPTDGTTHDCWGVTFVYSSNTNDWRPQDAPTGDSWDPLSYDREITYVTRITYIPRTLQQNDILWQQIREERTRRIESVEWRYNRYARETRLGITPTDDITALDTYIQALADITEQEDPTNITWPTLS
jgi:hypothetical protein